MLDSQICGSVNFKRIGLHLSRPRSQRGELSDVMPKRGKLARGRYWARWRIYSRQADGTEKVSRAEKIDSSEEFMGKLGLGQFSK